MFFENDGFDALIRRAKMEKKYHLLREIEKAKFEAERLEIEILKCPKCGRLRSETVYGLFCKCELG